MTQGLSIFNRRPPKRKPALLKSATISDFGGGLDVIDNEITMKSRYARVLRNWNKNNDGSQSVRFGTKFRYNIASAVDGNLIELAYFASHLIAFTTDGQIAKVTEAGVITAIWNDAIASALVGAPDGWSTGLVVGSIDYTEFRGELIVCNGVDKPLIIHDDLTVEYLNDPATGSNVNTPIGMFCTTVSNFCVIAGIDTAESEIYISSQGTSGVWFGDDDPNDAVIVDIGAWVPQNSGAILGLGSFRNFLLVAFEGAIVVIELGAYEEDVHQPQVQDNIISHGIVSHRTTVTTKADFVMADVLGWHTAVRNQFGLIDTKLLSELIDPMFIAAVPAGADDRKRCFSVRVQPENRIVTFIPDASGNITGYVMTSSDKETIKNPAWNTWDGWTFTCGASSARGRVFLGEGTKIYLMGNTVYEDEQYYADYIADTEAIWTVATSYTTGDVVLHEDSYYKCLVTHTSSDDFDDDFDAEYWEDYIGEEISFDWELPWVDVNQRVMTKRLAYLQADTRGGATFTISFFADNFYLDENQDYDPAIEMNFVAGDAGGYGVPGGQPYGGGRRARDERPWGTPLDFKIMKLRIHGTTKYELGIITLSILYNMGTYRRS